MNFTLYDIILLAIFVVFTSIFLYTRRKNLKREGLLFLYKTRLGVRLINRIGNKYKKTLNVLGYVSIILGFLLMIFMIYFFGKMVWIYVFNAQLVQMIKIPPIAPLLPYLPQIFKITFLPPFYFIYWIIIIAIVAIIHEFSHGIFAVNKKVGIKSTGFGFFPFFFPIFLAAFVELDEKKMAKKKISSQMAVLSAGTFSNLLTAVFFLGVLALFFSLAFSPAGVVFDSYTYSAISLAGISSINNISVNNVTYNQLVGLANETILTEVKENGTSFYLTADFLQKQTGSSQYILAYDDAPAIKANLSNTILKINGIGVKSREKLGEEIGKYKPGDEIIITALSDGADRDYRITLGENPSNSSAPYLGIGFIDRKNVGILGGVINFFSSFRDPSIYYQTNFGAAEWFYDLLWWLVMICFSVALVNMLPVGIFDGGRFFYLAMLAITKSEKTSKKIFSLVTYLFMALVVVIMVFWALSFFR